ncbi:GNAT family N-acetyltransferase [Clostridium sp. 'deep sea']|uniref:GNAT family N-acetyltransferase n=1 Tax=Clostridium sp. 'deep sea' TaxID=2779445 RepID=UPI001A9AA3BC|nr:GNAT family N-acetyltransferase [Clostridium sp. 'deep sea']
MLSDLVSKNPCYVAIEKDKVIGYISGISNIKELKASLTGVYVPEWAHSVKVNVDREKVYNALYKTIAKEWVRLGNFTHIISFYGNEHKLHNLFVEFGFGMLTIDGIKQVNKNNDIISVDNLMIREMCEQDIYEVGLLHNELINHLLSSPIYLYLNNPKLSSDELKNKFMSKNIKTFVALKNKEIISAIRVMLNNGPGCKTVIDKGTLGINFAYTKNKYRGCGVTPCLLREVLKWGSKHDMIRCVVDFESQNRPATKFWLKHFKPVCKTFMRKVDDRVQ